MTEDGERELQRAIGDTVRRLRRDRGLTLRQLADASGVSQAFLSQTENGHAAPSIMTLHRIATALGSSTHELLARSSAHVPLLTRGSTTETVGFRDGIAMRFLAPGQQRMVANEIIAEPGADAGEHASHGGEELVYVLEGELTVLLGDAEQHVLGSGDSLYYSAALDHRWSNASVGRTRFLIVNAPPSF